MEVRQKFNSPKKREKFINLLECHYDSKKLNYLFSLLTAVSSVILVSPGLKKKQTYFKKLAAGTHRFVLAILRQRAISLELP